MAAIMVTPLSDEARQAGEAVELGGGHSEVLEPAESCQCAA
eukprot:CAMPEP_0206036958 /NCGR_PEP_ID=MMETSP1466-20131121/3142_1 /ASSEMBLY_ACC=CAM_ASM_001126 /TAXON_ID=44452 /ORGANISM="Pavlova gyrans, Strain CCMP608" /LENGTH=40 /DNA_ID= /DNA_START= /DNA_END= /DNA_ORIENTATION=